MGGGKGSEWGGAPSVQTLSPGSVARRGTIVLKAIDAVFTMSARCLAVDG